jgi:type II secretory pathway pseudopilin PulG
MTRRHERVIRWIAGLTLALGVAASQTAYQPKFPGDPARSDSESAALGYMRTVLRAQKLYQRKNGNYATSLAQLVHTGSFTRRMVNPDRGDYTAGFRAHKDKDTFELTMTPKQLDREHRSFYADQDGKIHADEQGPASEKSSMVK